MDRNADIHNANGEELNTGRQDMSFGRKYYIPLKITKKWGWDGGYVT